MIKQWSTEAHAGFTRAEKPFINVISDGPYSYDKVNAAAQKTDPSSLLDWTERIIRARKEAPELGWGTFEMLDVGHNSVLAMRHHWRNNSIVTLHNFSGEAIEIELHLGDMPGRKLCNVSLTTTVTPMAAVAITSCCSRTITAGIASAVSVTYSIATTSRAARARDRRVHHRSTPRGAASAESCRGNR